MGLFYQSSLKDKNDANNYLDIKQLPPTRGVYHAGNLQDMILSRFWESS